MDSGACITCISSVFPDMQFESFFLIAQPKVSVLGESSATFVVPQVDPHDPLLGLVLGQRENLVQTEPVVLWGNKPSTKKGFFKFIWHQLTETDSFCSFEEAFI